MITAKRKRLISFAQRPSNPDVDIDFEAEGVGIYLEITHADAKTPISLQKLKRQGKAVSGPSSYRSAVFSMGKKLVRQKARFVGLEGGPRGPENVLHIIDLRKIENCQDKLEVVQGVYEGVELAGSTENIHFINFID